MNPPLLFGGIDPSGSEKKASGVALLDTERRLVEVKRLKRDDEIVAFFATHADRIRFIGNAAGAGARMALLSKRCKDEASVISEKTEYLELAGRPDFQMEFSSAMLFPES